MGKVRLEAFSDGVIAIIITIMDLEMKVPRSSNPEALSGIVPVLISYILSFIYIGIYWNNHHHLLHLVKVVNGKILWANLHLLFWLSLVPFVSGWMGQNNFAKWPVSLYGFVMLMCGVTYYILSKMLVAPAEQNAGLAKAIGKDRKAMLSLVLYVIGILTCLIHPMIGFIIYSLVAILWIVPDRIEKRVFP
jgi:uncharacterized membrane protein